MFKDGVKTIITTRYRIKNIYYGRNDTIIHSTWTSNKKHPRPPNAYDPQYHKKKYIQWRNHFLYGNRITIREAKYYLYRYADLQKQFGKKNYKAAIRHWRTQGRKEKRNKLAYKELTDDEAKCYLKRYPDVATSAAKSDDSLAYARKHFFMWGYFEHRNRYCAPRITDIQANCYIRRYPDMQQKYHGDIRSARRHWYKRGYKENRNHTCPDSPGPKKCADYGETCRCKGTIHMGRAIEEQLQPNDKATINKTIDWDKASGFKFASKWFANYTSKKCVTPMVGYNPNPYYAKQCFCEAAPRNKPRLCSKEGGKCECNGVAFYAQEKHNKTGNILNFKESLKENYLWKNATNEIQCSNKAFGGDPAPNYRKQCYCDDVGAVNYEKLSTDQIVYQTVITYVNVQEQETECEKHQHEEWEEERERLEKIEEQEKIIEEREIREEEERIRIDKIEYEKQI